MNKFAYLEENIEISERFELVSDRVKGIVYETTVEQPFRDFFIKEAQFLLTVFNLYEQVQYGDYDKFSLKELEEKEYTAAAGGGAVTVTVSGKKEVVSIKLSEEVVDPDDIEMLQDLIVAATNEAFRQMEAANSEAMSKLTGGLGGALGGGFPF